MQTIEHLCPNGDGWELSLFQTWDEACLVPGRRPVLIVPGYGMNSFIFSYHPRGPSLEGFLAARGFEVWRVDLRAQGGSRPARGPHRAAADLERFGLADLAVTDLGVALEAVVASTRTRASKVDVIGASLGGTLLFTHAVVAGTRRLGSLVAIGAPVRWVHIHPLLKLAFGSPTLVGLVHLRGTRRLAERLLPELVRRLPSVLSLYMNPEITDTAAAREMVKTVEDPNRHVNREIARWIAERDLVVRGVNVSEGLARVDNPLLCVLANGDGIVPAETARFAFDHVASREKALLEVGTRDVALAHADLFVSNEAHERVFAPVADWLAERSHGPSARP
jgi:pimeloyl-ACP methyl ester carboxylesterase